MTDITQPNPEPQEASSLPRYTIDCSSNEYGTHWNVEGDSEGSLCLYADAQSQLNALRAQLQEQALQYLSDNGQWIEETGKLRAELAALKAAPVVDVEAIMAMVEVYADWKSSYQHHRPRDRTLRELADAARSALRSAIEGGTP